MHHAHYVAVSLLVTATLTKLCSIDACSVQYYPILFAYKILSVLTLPNTPILLLRSLLTPFIGPPTYMC